MGVIIGIDPSKVRTSAEGAEFKLGSLGYEQESAGPPTTAMGVTGGSGSQDNSCKCYMYVEAAAAITGDGYVVIVDGSAFTAAMVTDTLSAPGSGQGKAVGVARAAIASGGFGWVQVYGAGTVRVLANAAAYTQLTTSATAGSLDDATTAGLEVVEGIALDAANGGSTANVAAWINWPVVSRTL